MVNIDASGTDSSYDDMFFDPDSYDDSGILKCCCGYELLLDDENNYRCSGGYHTYRVGKDEVFLDVFGNVMLKKPEHQGDKN